MAWYIYALITATLLGIDNIFSKSVLKREHSLEFLTVLYLVSTVLLLPFVGLVIIPSSTIFLLIVMRSIIMVITLLFFVKALKHMPISSVSPLSNLIPLFTLFFGFLILNEEIGVLQVIGILIIMIGSYMLNSDGHISHWLKPLQNMLKEKFMLYVILFIILRSLASVLSKTTISLGIDPFNALFYNTVFSFLLFATMTFFAYEGFKDIKEGLQIGGIRIVVISIFSLLAAYFVFLAYTDPTSKVSLVVPIVQLKGVIATVFGGFLFHEKHILIKALASLVMVGGVFLILI